MMDIFGDARPQDKRSPLVFCLDMTGSMGRPPEGNLPEAKWRITLLNKMVEKFLTRVMEVPKAGNAVEVAFVLFTHEIILETGFVNVCDIDETLFAKAMRRNTCGEVRLKPVSVKVQEGEESRLAYDRTTEIPVFSISMEDLGTKLATAVNYCMDKIEKRKQSYSVDHYAPFLVIVTDGDPDDVNTGRRMTDTEEEHQRAIDRIMDHCYAGHDGKNLIVPIVIGVGEKADEEKLRRYGAGFPEGYCRIRDECVEVDFKRAADFICNSVLQSINLTYQDHSHSPNQKARDSRGMNVREIFGT